MNATLKPVGARRRPRNRRLRALLLPPSDSPAMLARRRDARLLRCGAERAGGRGRTTAKVLAGLSVIAATAVAAWWVEDPFLRRGPGGMT